MSSTPFGVTHVLYLSEVHGRSPFSGAENHVLVLLEALAAAGIDVELIAMLWAGEEYAVVSAALSRLEGGGVRVVRVQRARKPTTIGRWWQMLRSWATLASLLRARRDRVIHLHLDLCVSPLITALAGCSKVLVSVHSDDPVYTTFRWHLWWHVVDACVGRYIAITHHVREYLQRAAGLPASRISTIYYGITPPRPVSNPRERLGIASDQFVVGFVGRIAPEKNLVAFVDAIATLPDVVAVIIGGGPLQSALARHVEARDITNVRLVGNIPDARVLMGAFDVFCLPSLWEGLGLVLIEAMLQRVPIAASKRGAIPEILDHGRFGELFEPTPEGISAAIAAVRARPEPARARAEQAYLHAANLFTVPRMVSETVAVYAAL